MKTIEQYIYEHIIKGHLKKQYKYYPKTKEKLIEAIQVELDKGNTDLNCIDTIEITDMKSLFNQTDGIKLTKEQQETLNVSRWDVSKVENMENMFFNCYQFNSDLSNWNVSKVKDMYGMFWHCYKFNSDLSKWNVSKVKNMNNMFCHCERFKSDLSKWNVSKVKKNMMGMFYQSGLYGKEPSWYKK